MFNKLIQQHLINKKILFVDDDKNIANMFVDLFTKGLGIEAHCAYDGKEGLNLLNKNNYDLIITDIKMPILNGHQMISNILEKDKEKDIKVIFLSGYKEEFYSDLLKEYRNNIVYISKPISTIKLQSALIKLFNIEQEIIK